MTALALGSNWSSFVGRPEHKRATLSEAVAPSLAAAQSAAFEPVPPAWLGAARHRLTEMAALEEGWDGHAGRLIDRDVLAFVTNLLDRVAVPGVPAPHLAPLSHGGIQLEWHAKGIDLEIEITEPYALSIWFEDHRTGDAWEKVFDGPDLSALDYPLQLLSER